MKVVLASGNKGKLRELTALLAPHGLTLLNQTDLGVSSAEETGDSFEANALLKARHAARATGLPAIADDSGIEVDALGGHPGVRSARFAGEHATDEQNLQLLLARLVATPEERRTARFRCVIVMVSSADDPQPLIARGAWEGTITQEKRGEGGFGYDPIFLPLGSTLTVAEIDDHAKNTMSHRAQALRALVAQEPWKSR
ncbi:MAG: dITP/XTP pyrophosphatase [Pseudomonadota bacterium]|jgi:XTP/dITP diphosphohydrolase